MLNRIACSTNPVDLFRVLHVNSRSLQKNYGELLNLIHIAETNFDIVAVTETWLTDQNDQLYQIPGYNFVNIHRTGKVGGGVGIYIESSYSYKVLVEYSIMLPYLESLFIEVQCVGNIKIIVGVVYRPPNSNFPDCLIKLEDILIGIDSSKSSFSVIAGDFNLDVLSAGVNPMVNDFLSTMNVHSYYPPITLPTRITGNSATVLDNFFVNTLRYTCTSAVIFNDLSDHLPIVLKINLNTKFLLNSSNLMSRRLLTSERNLAHFITALESESWLNITDPGSTVPETKKFNLFQERYCMLFDKSFPMTNVRKSKRNCPRKIWMTSALVKSCKKKSKLFKKWKLNHTIENENKYIKYQKILKTLLHAAERKYFADKFLSHSNNLKLMWKTIREVISTSGTSNLNTIFELDGKPVADPVSVATEFNTFFSNVGETLAKKIPKTDTTFDNFLSGNYPSSLSLRPTTTSEILSIVKELNNKTSAGWDGIPLNILKATINPIAKIISCLINNSFMFGYFPQELKTAKVCPIYKSGQKTVFSNYRPISVLSSFSKIFEKAMQNRLLAYIESKNILIPEQYGFRPHYSSYMALLDLTDRITTSFEEGKISIAILIDLQKAFDSLNHGILLKKLSHYGIRGVVLDWFTSYLTDRHQYVVYNNVCSNSQLIKWGIPQGSILGPLLFILYVNDIKNCSKILNLLLFADDTNLCYSGDSTAEVMRVVNVELGNLFVWFCANYLTLNVTKTNYIIFGNKRKFKIDKNFEIRFDNKIVERVQSAKFLGVYVDEDLSWKTHTSNTALKISRSIGMLRKTRYLFPNHILLQMYVSLILPQLTYCIIVWGGAHANAIQKLIILQKRAIRMVCASPYLSPTSVLFKRTGQLKLSDLHHYSIACFVYNRLHNLLPAKCGSYLVLHEVNAYKPYSLRNDLGLFVINRNRTVIRDRFVTTLGPKLWSKLPVEIRQIATVSSFKRQFKDSRLATY
jgi:Reverse transcriptase (RNA-dependent DNA polymerase)/Endonuclease/Exonuclease/phosphatase family